MDAVAFLQWALPRLRMRWRGFRNVRGQVVKRIARRFRSLGLDGFAAYRRHLEAHPQEWAHLDGLCRVTISRLYRDRAVYEHLERVVLPELAARGRARCWSAGCASGEEPYTLALVWRYRVAPRWPAATLHIVATDVDDRLLERAREGVYEAGSLRELPDDLRREAFARDGAAWRVRDELRALVEWRREDLRHAPPDGPFDLILCRNLAFTYFDDARQREVLDRLVAALREGGGLVVGGHESVAHARLCREGSLPIYRVTGSSTG